MSDDDDTEVELAPEGPIPEGPSGASTSPCPMCGEAVAPDHRYCEACGAPLSPETASGPVTISRPPDALTCPGCDASGEEAGDDGYCGRCGRRWSPVREHDELIDRGIAGVTDRGTAHWRNEDAVGLAAAAGDPGGFVLVVCDGVTSSQDSHLVSQAAVDAALPVLLDAVASSDDDLTAALIEATAAAQDGAAAVPHDPTREFGPGACTFVAAAIRGGQAAFASVGDSRAYWIDADGAVQIGRDDSLAAELVASGRATVEEAMASTGAHAITKWLGVDTVDATPAVTSLDLPGPGLVLLASDGLWNYTPDPKSLAELVGPLGEETPLDLARRLAAFAEEAGGADNITIAVGPYDLGGQETE